MMKVSTNSVFSIGTQQRPSCTGQSITEPQHNRHPLMQLQGGQDGADRNAGSFGTKLNGTTRPEPIICEEPRGLLAARCEEHNPLADVFIHGQQKLGDWIGAGWNRDQARILLSNIGIGWFSEFHRNPDDYCINGRIKLDRGFFHKKKTVWCCHLSLAYVLDRKNFLEAAQSPDTLKIYAQKNRRKYFSEAACASFDQGNGVVISKDRFGMLVCSLFEQMRQSKKSEVTAYLGTAPLVQGTGHATAVHLEIRDGIPPDIPPLYCVHCYDPNKSGTELTYELTFEGLQDRFNSQSGDYKSFFKDFFHDNPSLSVMVPTENAELLSNARSEKLIPMSLLKPDNLGRLRYCAMISHALDTSDAAYLVPCVHNLAADVKNWTRAEKKTLLNDLRDIHGFGYFFSRTNFLWYDSFKTRSPEAYRAFKAIKAQLKPG